MIRKEMATANSKSRAHVDTVSGVDVGFASLGSALSTFIGSTEGKGHSTSLSFYPKLFQEQILDGPALPGWSAEAYSAGLGEMH
jgi:hypothetical protein